MRIRTVKPEFFKHVDLFDAEKATGLPLRIAFAGLWCAADREGRFKWVPRALKTDILPYDEIDFISVLEALKKYGFILQYGDASQFGWIPTFLSHQHINMREQKSHIPNHPSCASTCINVHEPAVKQPENAPENSFQLQHEHLEHVEEENEERTCAHVGKGKEGKGKEGDRVEIDSLPPEALKWNELCGILPSVKLVGKARERKLKLRRREPFWVDNFEAAIGRLTDSKFATGDRGWIATFDFLLETGNIAKVMEGNYDNREGAVKAGSVWELQQVLQVKEDERNAIKAQWIIECGPEKKWQEGTPDDVKKRAVELRSEIQVLRSKIGATHD